MRLLFVLAGPPELPADPPPDPDAPIEVRAPEQVQQDVEQGEGTIATPEQVREQAAGKPIAEGGDPLATPPNPKAHPSEGVYAVGSGPVAPLPPPPPPVPSSAIQKFDWRGVMWLSVRLTVTGPLGGNYPARTGVVALGGGLEGGWRINQIAGLGLGLYRQPHEVIKTRAFEETVLRRGTMSNWDVAFLRLFAPVRGRVDPYVDLGGGLAFLEPAREGEPLDIGGTLRAGLGFDAWIAKNLTFGVSGLYRASFMSDSIGHAVQGAIDLSVHW
ncbi:hypothetical protein ACNOYE_38200 [Nannocystaceae bacterium ST9]